MRRGTQRFFTVAMAILLIGWPAAIAIPGGVGVASANHGEFDSSDSQFTEFEGNESLLIWERAVIPLRADTSDAETTIPLHELNLRDNRSGTIDTTSANRYDLAVYGADESITIEFSGVSGASVSNFADHETQIIIASVGENKPAEDFGGLDQLNETIDAFQEGNLSKVQEQSRERGINYTVTSGPRTDSNGELSFQFDPSGSPGPYAVMLALPTESPGFSTDSDDVLTLPGNATLVGTEMVMVQEDPSTISTSGVEPGDDLTVDVGTSLSGNVNHSVLVYNEDQFLSNDEKTEIELQDGLTTNLTSEDILVRHSIRDVNGVGNLTKDVDFLGVNFSAGTVSGTTPLANVVDRLDDEVGRNVRTQSISPNSTLDASAEAVVEGNSNEEVTLQTYANWSEGTYRVVHVAGDGTAGGLETNTQTITIQEATDSDDSDGGGGGTGQTPPRSQPEVIDNPEEVIDVPEDVTPTRAEQAQIVTDEETGQASVTFTEESSVESVTFDNPAVEGEVTVAEYDNEPEETGPSPGQSVSVSQITVPDPDQPATIRKRVPLDRIEERGVDAEDLRINRFDDEAGEWQGLDTEIVETTNERVVLEASTPGFSFFAVSAVSVPEATIDAPSEVTVDEEFTLDATDSSDRYGEIVAYEWGVDGETLTGETVTTAIDAAGDVTVELTVENDAGETDTETVTISVSEADADQDADTDAGDDQDTDTGTDDGTDTDTEDQQDGGLLPIAIVLLVIALVAGGVVWYVRQQNG
jgi:PGF-pre-PGF domain-containing protein